MDAFAVAGVMDDIYTERNLCVALLARMAVRLGLEVRVTRTTIEGWGDAWQNCIYIDLPTGQVSWHFNDDEMWMLEGLPAGPVEWDGHDTDEKYGRVAAAYKD